MNPLTSGHLHHHFTNVVASPKTVEPFSTSFLTSFELLGRSGVAGCLRPPRIACCQNWNPVQSMVHCTSQVSWTGFMGARTKKPRTWIRKVGVRFSSMGANASHLVCHPLKCTGDYSKSMVKLCPFSGNKGNVSVTTDRRAMMRVDWRTALSGQVQLQ